MNKNLIELCTLYFDKEDNSILINSPGLKGHGFLCENYSFFSLALDDISKYIRKIYEDKTLLSDLEN